MKAYKGFDKDLKCRGFQFEIGKTYTMMEGEPVKLCKRGFHACEKPLDCFGYYAPGLSRYCEVELADVSGERSGDSKRVAKTITIIKELTKDEMHDISQEGAENGGDGSSLRGGDGSRFCGKKNTVFAAEWRINNVFIGMRVAVVDGVNIKEDVWYDLDDNGEWKEADNQQDI